MRSAFIFGGLAALASATEDALTQYFVLKTKVLPGQTASNVNRFNNLYLGTGPVPGFPALYQQKEEQDQFYYFTPSNVTGKDVTYHNLAYKSSYSPTATSVNMNIQYNEEAAWQAVGLAKGLKAKNGFFTNSTGLQYNSDPETPSENQFGGWLVCEWWLLSPQLFWLTPNNAFGGGGIPNNCAKVHVIPIYASSSGTS